MFLAEKTVKNYVSNVLSKLGMSRRTEAAAYAARSPSDGLAPRARLKVTADGTFASVAISPRSVP